MSGVHFNNGSVSVNKPFELYVQVEALWWKYKLVCMSALVMGEGHKSCPMKWL